jgi:AMP phosphorylase
MMKLRTRLLGIESGGKPVITLSRDDAEELDVRSGERARLSYNNKEMTAIVNIMRSVPKGTIGIYDEIFKIWHIPDNQVIEVGNTSFPESLHLIQNKLKRMKLNYEEILKILQDVVAGNLREAEIASFVTALDQQGLDLDEATSLTVAMVETGKSLKLSDKGPICDKHSIGGVPGDKTSLLVVPIIAAAGLTIPKTSSRAITSAGGTADRAEVLMPVNLDTDEMKKVVIKTKGCIVWGGSLDLAPADDIFVQIEYPLSIDPLLMPSIMAKKKAVGANYLALDIPAGRGTKVKTIGDADLLAKDFMQLGKRLGIETQCVISFGEQPVGHTIGPALEAREALKVLSGEALVPDLVDKAVHLCGLLFSMTGKQSGERLAMNILKTGKAEKKMREIIAGQGGDPDVESGDIEIGSQSIDIKSENSGTVLWMDNQLLIQIARAAGAPKDRKAGIVIHKKIGQRVKKGESIITVFSERASKLGSAERILNEFAPLRVGDRREMIIHKVVEIPEPKKAFILER